jgi:hypothetical protein
LFQIISYLIAQSEKRASSAAGQEMWALLDENWTKLEPILLESLIVLEGTIMALKMRECCAKLRVHLLQKKSVEQAFICYNVCPSPRSLFENVADDPLFIQELSALIKTSLSNRLPDQEISQLMALKQRQQARKETLMVKDDAVLLQQELDF